MTFSPIDPMPRLTMQERWDLIEALAAMINADFGTRDPQRDFDPFEPGDIARHGLVEVASAYRKFGELDDEAEDIIDRWKRGGIDSDNLVPVDV